MRAILIAALLATVVPAGAFAQGKPMTTAETTIGALIENPASKAVLDKHLPGFSTNEQLAQARSITLKALQQYMGAQLTDKVLADIDADLAKIK